MINAIKNDLLRGVSKRQFTFQFNSSAKKAPLCEDVKNKTLTKNRTRKFLQWLLLDTSSTYSHDMEIFAKSSTILSSVRAQIILLTRFLSWQSFIVSHKRMDSNSSLEAFLTIAGSEAIRCYILLTRQMVLRRSLKGMKLKTHGAKSHLQKVRWIVPWTNLKWLL